MANATVPLQSALTRYFERRLGLPVDIKINQNRKTMLSVLEKNQKRVRLSLHEIFLQAPKHVMEAAVHFVQSKNQQSLKVLQLYIHEKMLESRPSRSCLEDEVQVRGRFYDLQKEWDIVNRTYFGGKVRVHLTWYGDASKKCRRKVILGSYDQRQNLIKIHRRLDAPIVPRYYLQFVLYHEALHKLYPPYLDENGNLKVHHEEFKEKEKLFKEFALAQHFEKLGRKYWFDSRR